jgi:hypothetical protein
MRSILLAGAVVLASLAGVGVAEAKRDLGGRPGAWCGWWMRTQLGGGPEYNLAKRQGPMDRQIRQRRRPRPRACAIGFRRCFPGGLMPTVAVRQKS